jgi:hypothetical protein
VRGDGRLVACVGVDGSQRVCGRTARSVWDGRLAVPLCVCVDGRLAVPLCVCLWTEGSQHKGGEAA